MKVIFVSLGCDKNLVDTEHMIGSLAGRELPGSGGAFVFTDDEQEADIAVVNTCAFIDSAKQESIETILSLAALKEEGNLKALVITGCLAQRYQKEVLDEIPEIDAVIGTTAQDSLLEVLAGLFPEQQNENNNPEKHLMRFEAPDRAPQATGKRVLTTGGHYEYLKIAEGCSKNCSYCAIPSIRGPYRSIPMEQLLAQAEELAAQGVRELILVAQETTIYGVDLYGHRALNELLSKLCEIEGFEWIRLLYCYPEEITEELVDFVAAHPKVLPYFDMPIQHISDDILKKMNRRTTKEELTGKIRMIREKLPEVTLRTTLITGFPGETEENHQELLDFIRETGFDRLGVFTYSREENTPAASMKPQIPARTKKRRQKELMLAQQEIAFRKAASHVGKTYRAIIEGRVTQEAAFDAADLSDSRFVYMARTAMDAPGVDGLLFVQSDRELMTGDFIQVRVSGAREYDLIGREIDD